MIRRLFAWLFVLVVLTAAAGTAAAWWAWQQLHEPYAGWAGGAVTLTVEPGTAAHTILHRLESEGVLADAELTRLFLIHRLGDPPLHAGDYRFDRPQTVPEVLDVLIRGDVVTYPVTIVEGLTALETAQAIAAAGFSDVGSLLAEMNDPARIAALDPQAEDLEGYLYPDTYTFARGTEAPDIVDKLVDTFRKRWTREVEPLLVDGEPPIEGVRDLGPLRAVVILASIIEKESQLDEERAVVASVYTNRLRIGMGLYADPTVIFALKRMGTWDGNLQRDDLRLDDPYNTYVVAGLPPGPICSPSVASLIAAVSPADTEYLYFVSRNDGSHVFARTLREHNRNVDRWQKRYWRERWAKERALRQGDGST
ncbi:MAG: endolytic transglycosylase MltG [Acidobacteriota bacterium]